MKLIVFTMLMFFSACLWATDFSTHIKDIKIDLVEQSYKLNADIDYQLSPVAREALQKGIALTWEILIKVEEKGLFWNKTLRTLDEKYQIQNHALLNLYSIKRLSTGERSLFSSLAGALNFISKIRNKNVIDKQLIQAGKPYHLAIKVEFKRELLPVPLRPFSYFDSQWALSSQWILWPFQN